MVFSVNRIKDAINDINTLVKRKTSKAKPNVQRKKPEIIKKNLVPTRFVPVRWMGDYIFFLILMKIKFIFMLIFNN